MANIGALCRCGSFRRPRPGNDWSDLARVCGLLEVWNRLRRRWSYVLRTRAYESVVGCLLENVCAPADDATQCERWRNMEDRHAERPDLRGELLAFNTCWK